MIAEIVSLPGYEAQVSASLREEERMALEFFIACAPEDHPVIPGGGGFSQGTLGPPGQGKERRLPGRLFFLAVPGRIYMAAIYSKSRMDTLSAADRNALAKLAVQIKRAAKEG